MGRRAERSLPELHRRATPARQHVVHGGGDEMARRVGLVTLGQHGVVFGVGMAKAGREAEDSRNRRR